MAELLATRASRGHRTLCLPIAEESYRRIVADPAEFRGALDDCYRRSPELFPADFARGFQLKDHRMSAKQGLPIRRIVTRDGAAYSVRPSFLMPYMTARVAEVEGPLFLRKFGVPFWAYRHPGGHRTSNRLDRQMRGMNRYFDHGQHLHGSRGACRLHCRAWALLWNFTPWHPATTRANQDWRCPAERLNRHRYHDCWLQNLLISASLGGYRTPYPQNP